MKINIIIMEQLKNKNIKEIFEMIEESIFRIQNKNNQNIGNKFWG
ncbi:MAG: hypothetical protein ACTSRP_05130 [Candidatus Helarchaeota archaeon]